MLLAEQGAEVVHVSPPGAERWRDASNAFLQRMKNVVTLDLRAEAGKRAAVDPGARR
jgi:crotonobetainyl-CoA:carnitine CoA-transferase CaiB-like acyl-CoA transferase